MTRNPTRAIDEAQRLVTRQSSRKALKAQQAERRAAAVQLAEERASVADVLELTRDLPTDASGTIYGPDGKPLLSPIVRDYTKTYAEKEGDPVRLHAEDILKRAARMQRDGASLERISAELDLIPGMPRAVFERALRLGHELLARDIAAGVEPEESQVVVGFKAADEPE